MSMSKEDIIKANKERGVVIAALEKRLERAKKVEKNLLKSIIALDHLKEVIAERDGKILALEERIGNLMGEVEFE